MQHLHQEIMQSDSKCNQLEYVERSLQLENEQMIETIANLKQEVMTEKEKTSKYKEINSHLSLDIKKLNKQTSGISDQILHIELAKRKEKIDQQQSDLEELVNKIEEEKESNFSLKGQDSQFKDALRSRNKPDHNYIKTVIIICLI